MATTLIGTSITFVGGRSFHVVSETEIHGALRLTLGEEIVHQCPPEGSGTMPCCGKTPFEVPRYHRMTVTEEVTCGKDWS